MKAIPKKVRDLRPNPGNPRIVTEAKLGQLKRSMLEFGDISGIVFNVETGNVVGGTQRTRNIDKTAKVAITKRFPKPSRTGTLAVGYVEQDGERFSYREVRWGRHREMAANLAANKGVGIWDDEKLVTWMKELSSFDVDFDLSLTMFDDAELVKFDTTTVKEHERQTKKKKKTNTPVPVMGRTYLFGVHQLYVGMDDLPGVVFLFEQWEKRTGQEVREISSTGRSVKKAKDEWSAGSAGISSRPKKKTVTFDALVAR